MGVLSRSGFDEFLMDFCWSWHFKPTYKLISTGWYIKLGYYHIEYKNTFYDVIGLNSNRRQLENPQEGGPVVKPLL